MSENNNKIEFVNEIVEYLSKMKQYDPNVKNLRVNYLVRYMYI